MQHPPSLVSLSPTASSCSGLEVFLLPCASALLEGQPSLGLVHSPSQGHTEEGEGQTLDIAANSSESMVGAYLVEGQLDPSHEVVQLPLRPLLQLISVVPCHVAVMVSQLLVCGRWEVKM